MAKFTELVFILLIVTSALMVVQNQIQVADFEITRGIGYTVTTSSNILSNITGKKISSIVECTQECLQHPLCETATYYAQTQSCLLLRERYGLGQVTNIGNDAVSMVTLNYRIPPGKI